VRVLVLGVEFDEAEVFVGIFEDQRDVYRGIDTFREQLAFLFAVLE